MCMIMTKTSSYLLMTAPLMTAPLHSVKCVESLRVLLSLSAFLCDVQGQHAYVHATATCSKHLCTRSKAAAAHNAFASCSKSLQSPTGVCGFACSTPAECCCCCAPSAAPQTTSAAASAAAAWPLASSRMDLSELVSVTSNTGTHT